MTEINNDLIDGYKNTRHSYKPHFLSKLPSTMSQPQPQPATASALPEGITDSTWKPLPGRVGNLTVIQQHTLTKFKK
jgi:hypothetical protein